MFKLSFPLTRYYLTARTTSEQQRCHPTPKIGTHLRHLDSLRGIACLMVLFAHLNAVPLLAGIPDYVGAAGVGIFFVLSGFLITRILLADRLAGKSLTEFYNRRVARIFPIYYLTLATIAVFWPGKEIAWAATFSFNFQFLAGAHNYFSAEAAAAMPPVAHFWSLCVEEHFYWLWPIAVMVLPRFSLRYVLGLLILATPAMTYFLARWLGSAGFSNSDVEGLLSRVTFTQLVAISFGGLIALHESWLSQPALTLGKRSLPRAALVGTMLIIAGVVWSLASVKKMAVLHSALAGTSLHVICSGVFLIAFAIESLGRSHSLVSIGTISYGLYLYHLPVYAALGLTNLNGAASVWIGLVALTTTLILAAMSYRFVERPILNFVRTRQKTREPNKRSYSAHLGKLLTFTVAVLFAYSMTKSILELRRVASSMVPMRTVETDVAAAPVTGFKATVSTIVVGSSHAHMGIAAPEFHDVAYNLGFGGQDAWYDCEIVKSYVGRLPSLKRVVFCVDGLTIHSSLAATESQKWRQSLYYHAYGIRARFHDESLYSPIVLASTEVARCSLDMMKKQQELFDEPNRGWLQAWENTGAFNQEYGKQRAHSFEHVLLPRVEENVSYFLATIQLCQSRGIECILVTVPTHASYRDNFSPQYRAETEAAIQRIVEATGVSFLNYEGDHRFVEGDFFDCDHLNKLGAIKFTRILDADLPR